MDLIDRYLTAIRWNLPRGVRADDVIAELRDVIASRVEDREEALGRALGKGEVSDLLRDFGHPLIVASRYGERQWLIGPDLFPFYFFVLKIVVAIGIAIMAVSAAAGILFDGQPVVRSIAHDIGGGWWSLLANAGLVTLIFAVIERTGWLTDHLDRWKPESLPDFGNFRVKPKSRWESLFEIAVGIGFILWWTGLLRLPIAYTNVKGLTVAADPVWAAMWWPILILMSARVVQDAIVWLRPSWRTARAAFALLTTAGTLALLSLLLRAGHWVTVASASLDAARLAEIDRSLTLSIHWAIVIAGAITVFQCLQELWRLFATRPLRAARA